jgi:hypothetical protein
MSLADAMNLTPERSSSGIVMRDRFERRTMRRVEPFAGERRLPPARIHRTLGVRHKAR